MKLSKGFIQHHLHSIIINMFNNIKITKKHNYKFRLSGESGAGFTIIEMVVVMTVFLFIIGAALSIFISIVQNQKKVLSEEQVLNQISYAEEYMSKSLRMAKTEPQDYSSPCLIDHTATNPADHPGYVYLLTRLGTDGLFKGIKFINESDNDNCWEFFLDNSTHGDQTTPLVLKEEINGNGDGTKAIPLTSTDLQISSVRFSINGSDGSASPNICDGGPQNCGASDNDSVNDSVQPRVTMLFNIIIPGDSLSAGVTCSSATVCPAGEACDLSAHTCVSTRTIQTTVSRRTLNIQQ